MTTRSIHTEFILVKEFPHKYEIDPRRANGVAVRETGEVFVFPENMISEDHMRARIKGQLKQSRVKSSVQ